MTKHVEPPFLQDDAIDVGGVVRSLNALRKLSQRRYPNGPPPELPSRASIKAIVEDLVATLYPRHFAPAHALPDLEGFLNVTLDSALASLREQIRRELQLANGMDAAALAQKAKEMTRAFAQTLPKTRALLDTDVRAAFDGDPAARSLDEVIFCYPGVAAVIRHRLAHQLYLLGAPMLARIVAELAHAETGIDIHPGAEIDESFFIDHGTGVVIGETARIGKRVRLYQAVTLGAKRFETDANGALVKGQPRHPIIEDEVAIYAGATVLGRITVGRGSSIGGNVWLTHSVPPGSNITQAKARVESFSDGAGI
ncbi:serine O-acetyltransferase EpsC [Methylocystis bryophila]|uniref:Serine acetyltransferase n=1 Tax=Methylocystis bryophila TaxID=655015 RepID=A0A1W6MYZ5_9HYPH|nr:serine O-acetyltransferase EpsC [Methylocystis bryophila]ARN82811.1 serine acetyltransferase [Methylocystis bryophila]BDV39061.1 serine acetyltransferase [Methylocystis bryophila]